VRHGLRPARWGRGIPFSPEARRLPGTSMPTGAARDGREVMGAPMPIFLEGRADPVQRLAMRQKGRQALEVVEANRHIMRYAGT